MSFIETIERARILLERNGRLSIRALQREFDLDADALEELVEELVDVQQVAAREGKILSWLGEAPIPALESVAALDPREYTPRHLAEKILRSRSALEGERKHVTVLFADVEGSMELAGRLEAEEWHRLLDRFFGILTAGVHRFEGTVNQYTGDGIMALFGAPIAHEDHAQRACHAALYLRDVLADYAAELRRSQGLEFAVRMGLNTGDVVVGRIGDDLRMDYTAQGQSVGLAQRLEQMAPGGSIYLSDATAQLVTGYFELRDRGEATAKGIADPVSVFELVDLGSHRTRLDVARGRGLTRFVGRTADLQTLEAALEQACAGEGQVVGVVAEAGVGKSRLCLEFVERCRAREIRVDEGHCLSHGEAVPLLPLLELLRGVFAIGEGASGAEARARIEDQLPNLEDGFRALLPLLFDLLGVADPERPMPPLSPEVRERQLSALLRHLVRDRGEREPRVLFIDDAHWIDPASDALLAQMIEAVPGTRTLVVFNFRPEYRAEWMSRSHYRQLPLLPLGREATGELLADLLGPDPSLLGLAGEIHERTGGNPFFVEEVVLSLVESGCLAGERGAYRRVEKVDGLEIPHGVQAVLAARIDRLPEREKRLLQTASVVGRQVFEPVLERVVALPESDLADALGTLVRREFLFEEALHPDAGYAFKHPLTHEVAYRSQLTEGRARTHGLVAEAIEAVYAGDLDEQSALLAYHWEQAREPVAAAHWNIRAAARGEATFDLEGANSHWRKARALLVEAPESDERDQVELEACRQHLTFLAWMGGSEEEMTALFERGIALAAARGEPRIQGQLHIHYGVWRCFSANDLPSLGTHVRAAAEFAEQVGDAGIAIASAAGLSLLGYTEGRLPEAIAIGRRALEHAPDDPMIGAEYWAPPPAMWLRGFVLSLEGWAGRPAESLAALEGTMEQARALGSEVFIAIASLWSGQVAEILGDAREMMVHARRLESFIEKAGVPLGGSSLYYRGMAHLLDGNAAEAVPCLERARDIHEESPAAPLDVVGSWCRLAVAYAEEGEAELACATSERGLALTRERLPVMVAPALTMHSRVLRRTRGGGEREAIEAALAEAETCVERVGLGCCRPFIHAERAALAGLLGDGATLEREGRAARRLFNDMGASGHVERLEHELGRLG